MKVLKPGTTLDIFPAQVTCGCCGAVLEYGVDDIKHGVRDRPHLDCPECLAFVALPLRVLFRGS